MKCPLCHSEARVFLREDHVPVNQNMILRSQKEALEIPRGNLRFAKCRRCGFIFNKAFDIKQRMYGDTYQNDQMHSTAFRGYVDSLLDDLLTKGVRSCRVVEIGCGNGVFLKELVERGKNEGFGFDPCYNGPLSIGDNLKFEKSYYRGGIEADVVIMRQVIGIIPDPVGFLSKITIAQGGRIFVETPCVDWILKNQAVWDFFYEHCSYFSIGTLSIALEMSGYMVGNISKVFNGQYLLAEAVARVPFTPVSQELLTDKVRELAPVALWGGGAKGVTFANMTDPKHENIACVVDSNPNKQGGYIAGTGHPIVDYRELPKFGVKTVIVMNPNYYAECLALLSAAYSYIELIGIFDLL